MSPLTFQVYMKEMHVWLRHCWGRSAILKMPSEWQNIHVHSSVLHREYFMESAGVRYLRTSCWHIRNRSSEHSKQVIFLIQKQRVRKYRTKHFPCGIINVFIIYILRHSSFWWPFYFKSCKNTEICRYTYRKMTTKTKCQLFSKNVC